MTRQQALGIAGHLLSWSLTLAAMLAAGWALFSAFVLHVTRPADMVLGMLLAYLLWLAALLLAAAIHEGGHMLAGRIAGLEVLFLLLGPMMVLNTARGRMVRLNRQVLTKPFAVALTAHGAADRAGGWVVAMAGGPAASAALACAAGLAIAGAAPGTAPLAVLQALAAFGVAGCVANLVPCRFGAMSSDGAQILDTLRNVPGLAARRAMSRITAAMLGGVRPRDWDPRDVDAALALAEPVELRAGALTLALLHARDRADAARVRETRAELASLSGMLPRRQRAAAAAELAVDATEADEVRRWLALARDGGDRIDVARAELAAALAESRSDDARRALAALRRELARLPVPGLAEPLREACADAERRLFASAT